MFALQSGPAYSKTVGSFPHWKLLWDYEPSGSEVHVEDGWEWIDGVCCEVFRHPGGGYIAQPTGVCEEAEELQLAA